MELLDGFQQAALARVSSQSAPLAVAERRHSRTAFTSLGRRTAAKVDRTAFSSISHARDEAPKLRHGQRVIRYRNAFLAETRLGNSQHGLVASLTPMATPTSNGSYAPLNLTLVQTPSGFEPETSSAPVQLPNNLDEGVTATLAHVKITPITETGTPISDPGENNGASVVYPNAAPDTDQIAQPTPTGFELSAILRSPESPRTVRYRLEGPAGLALTQPTTEGPVEVLENGVHTGVIAPPSAIDAAGNPVPVSLALQGSTLVVSVDPNLEETDWPVDVDPGWYYVNDSTLPVAGGAPTNWAEFHSPAVGISYGPTPGAWVSAGSSNGGEYGGLEYEAKGDTRIYYAEDESSASVEPTGTDTLEQFVNPGHANNYAYMSLGGNYTNGTDYLCAQNIYPCYAEYGYPDNIFLLEAIAGINAPGRSWWFSIQRAKLYMAEEHGTEAYFNTTSATIAKAGERLNVLTGPTGSWLSGHSGAFEVIARNPGMGLSTVTIEEVGSGTFKVIDDNHAKGECYGEQCPTEDPKAYTYSEALSAGEHKVRIAALGSDNSLAEQTQTVKIDGQPPENLEATGWPTAHEIGPVPATLTVEATDGTAPAASSGVKSLSVSLDGETPKVVPEADCAPGPCAAQGTYVVNADNLSEGVHRLILTAIDNAGNEARPRVFYFDVRHAQPLPVGPGGVEPTTGQLELSTTDATLSSATAVSRTYRSREIPALNSGPLGPQWSLSLGGSEYIQVMPNGEAALSAANRSRTSFQPKGTHEFTSPNGDSNLQLTSREAVPGHGITEYVMKDTHAGASVTYTQPLGTQETAPVLEQQFGAEGITMTPAGSATDQAGDVWVVDAANSRLLEFNPAGELLREAGHFGAGSGQLRQPAGVAINQTTGNLYVGDGGNHRIDEFNPDGHFIEALGRFGQGTGEYQACTANCSPGLAPDGAPAGAINKPVALTIDSAGAVWVADAGYNQLTALGTKGEVSSMGTSGSGHGQLTEPTGIAYANGDLFISEAGNARVQVLTPAGAFVREIGQKGSGAGELNRPSGVAVDASGRLYISDASSDRVVEYTAEGDLVTLFGSKEPRGGELTTPNSIAISSKGSIYITDSKSDLVELWARNLWLPTHTEGPVRTTDASSDFSLVTIEPGRSELLPTELLAPTPAGVSCGTTPAEVKKGCRALLLNFTKGTGTASSEEWGSYKGRLDSVELDAYNPVTGNVEPKAVAKYSYDNQGRLRAEWDPRVTPGPLKTEYGYDQEGHLTALTPPGQQTWEFTYGTTGSDLNPGRLLKVSRGGAKTALWKGASATNTQKPTITGTPAAGSRLTASAGEWSNEPSETLAYGFQWNRCSSTGTECTPIPGGVNQSYTPILADVGHKLSATIQAANGAGTKTVEASQTNTVTGAGFSLVRNIGSSGTREAEFKEPAAIAIAPSGNVWIADGVNHRLQEFSPEGHFIAAVGWGVTDGKEEFERCTTNCRAGTSGQGSGQFSDPEGLAINTQSGQIYVADSADNRVDILTSTGAPLVTFSNYGNLHLSDPHGLAIDASGNVWVADTQNNHLVEFNAEGKSVAVIGSEGEGVGQYKGIKGVAAAHGEIYATDTGNAKVKVYTESSNPQLLKEFGETGSGKGKFVYPWAITYDAASETLLVSSYGDGRIESYTLSGTPTEEFGHQGAAPENINGPSGIAASPTTGAVYVADEYNNRVDIWAPGGVTTEPVQPAPALPHGSVYTVDYNVPTSGGAIEHALTPSETKRWGQEHDLPVEGTAVFPADRPMGWPAANYEGATIAYLDSRSQLVNTVSRTGGISTTEYNAENEAVRTLSAADLEQALRQPEPAAAARTLDTKNSYNEEGQLTETIGPLHTLEVAHGAHGTPEEVHGRDHLNRTYDATHGVITREDAYVLASSNEPLDHRTTTYSYDGQNGRGWTLRKPTSVTTDVGGTNLTTTTEYDEATGQVSSVRGPGKSQTEAPLYRKAIAQAGSGPGQASSPQAVTTDYSGNVWVADTANRRVDEFSPTGTFLLAAGWGVKSGEEQLELCTTSCKAGLETTEAIKKGQFVRPVALAWNGRTNSLYITDAGHDDIVQLTIKKGRLKMKAFGTAGAGKNQYEQPEGMTSLINGNMWVADRGNHRLVEISDKGKYITTAAENQGEFTDVTSCPATGTGTIFALNAATHQIDVIAAEPHGAVRTQFGSTAPEGGSLRQPGGITCDPSSGQLYVSDRETNRIDIYSTSGTFAQAFGIPGAAAGQLNTPGRLVVTSAGATYVADTANNRVAEWSPSAEGARKTRTYYYTAEEESPVKACRNHPEWAALTCKTEPAEQPGAPSTAPLPEITVAAYNMFDEPERRVEQFGTTTREKLTKYDAAGRVTRSETTGAGSEPIPSATDSYNSSTGALETVTSGSETEVTHVNHVGAIESYSDGSSETSYEYEPYGAERLTRYADGKGEQTYGYESKTGLRTNLLDPAIGTITATYDSEGRISSETLPDKLTEHWEYNETGATTRIKYEKAAHCASTCPETWYSDALTEGSHGEAMAEQSTFAKYAYRYDTAGRMLEVAEQPSAGGCRSREYRYAEAGLRTEELWREGPSTTCPGEGGAALPHVYDSAGHLADPEVQYDGYGDITQLPGQDAEGHPLKSSYYVDGAVASTTQNNQTIKYTYDAFGRERETQTTGSESTSTTQHYPSMEAGTASWTAETGKWTRDVPGIAGELIALEPSVGSTTLQLHDLHGDIVATAGTTEADQKLLSTFPTTETGAPVGGDTPPRNSWLADGGAASQYSHGVSVSTGSGAAYVPQLARNLQSATVETPGSCPTGCGHEQPREPTLNMVGVEATEALAAQIVAEEEAARQRAEAEENAGLVEEDPVRHWRAYEALETGEKLIKLASFGDFASKLHGLASIGINVTETLVEGVFEAITVGTVTQWIEHFGEFLVGCTNVLHEEHRSHGGCRSAYGDFLGVPNFFKDAEVSECEGMSSDTREVHWCYRIGFKNQGGSKNEA